MLRISIISPKISMNVINKVIEKNKYNCTFFFYTYDHLEDILDIYEECHEKVDGIFFSGEYGFLYACQNIKNLNIPCKFITYSTIDILSILLNFVMDYPEIPLNRVFIDFMLPLNNYYGIKELIKKEHLPICNEVDVIDYDDLLQRLNELWVNDKIDMILTRSTNSLNRIQELGIPYIHIVPSENIISNAIEQALKKIGEFKDGSSPKIICIIKPKYNENSNMNEQEYIAITIYKALVDIKKELDKNINITQLTDRFELLFYDDEEELTLKNTKCIMSKLWQISKCDFNLGVGISSSFDNSRYLAETALRESVLYGLNDGFAAYENGNISGPLLETETLTYSIINSKIGYFAKENNIDVTNMSRIQGIYLKNKDEILNSDGLSKWLNITKRSCNRILLQLQKHKLIEEIEVLEGKGKGRPQKYYKFIQANIEEAFG